MVRIIRHDDGVWTVAQAKHAGKPYYVETKHHEQPKEFGIQNGKISKLFIYAGTSWDEKRCVCALTTDGTSYRKREPPRLSAMKSSRCTTDT